MGELMKFDYYYGIEAEQFSFYRVPRLLIKDERFKGLSSDAKLLYGLMLDRMSLSMKNGWLDDENRAYIIYTVDAIMEDLGCAKATCVKIMKELDTEKGIGLIEKKRRGLGKPDIIYVKNFSTISEEKQEEKPANTDKTTEVQKLNFKKSNTDISRSSEIELQEVQNLNCQKFRNNTSRSSEAELAEVQELVPNYTNTSYTDQSNTEMSYINPINLSENREQEEKQMDKMDGVNTYIALIKENIEYEHHSLWKELITHYYRDNMMIGEYFGGSDEKLDKIIIEKNDVSEVIPLEKYVPVNLNTGSGLRIFFSYIPNFTMNKDYDITVRSVTYIEEKTGKTKVMESETITVLKLLSRFGLKVRIPVTARMAHEDMIFNFPTFVCKDIDSVEKLQHAMSELCKCWHNNGDDRLISYSFQVNYSEEAVLISLAGHVDDFCKVFEKIGVDFPQEESFFDWIDTLYNYNNKFTVANFYPKVSDIMTKAGLLKFMRAYVPQQYLCNPKIEGKNLTVSFAEKKEIVQEIIENKIGIAPAYHVKKSICMRCGKEYMDCECIKFIDDIGEAIKDMEFKGATWTNRHA